MSKDDSPNPPAAQPPRKPLGPPLSYEALMALATITPADVRIADALWRRHAPAKYRRLLRARRKGKGKGPKDQEAKRSIQ